MRESVFQASLIRTIQNLLPGSIVLKNDCDYMQGIPDLSIYYGPKWCYLEVKASKDAPHRPNQDYYINYANQCGSFGRFIYPENVQQTLQEMIAYFKKI
jgi:hypothetical protein